MLLKLIWKLDKWAHLCGAFTLTTILLRLCGDTLTTIAVIAIGSLLLECYQWARQPWYAGKEADTVLDLIADGIGIVGAVAIRGGL